MAREGDAGRRWGLGLPNEQAADDCVGAARKATQLLARAGVGFALLPPAANGRDLPKAVPRLDDPVLGKRDRPVGSNYIRGSDFAAPASMRVSSPRGICRSRHPATPACPFVQPFSAGVEDTRHRRQTRAILLRSRQCVKVFGSVRLMPSPCPREVTQRQLTSRFHGVYSCYS